jgi:cell division septation protein DedD
VAEETSSVEDSPGEKTGKPATTEEPRVESRIPRVLAWVALVLLGLFVSVQLAGVLLRDRLERRRPLLAHAPPPEPTVPGKAMGQRAEGPEPSRFGPEIQEVVVAGAGTGAPTGQPEASPAAATPAPGAPVPKAAQEEPVASKTAPKEALPAKPARETAKSAREPAPPEPARETASASRGTEKGTHVLLVDVFLSQQYLKEAEQRLKSLGLPWMHTEFLRKGKGFKVRVSGGKEADREKAGKTMEANGYLHRADGGGVEAYFYYRRETPALVDALAKQGLQATVEAVDGDRPYWRLYAGPFSEQDAAKAQQRLEAAGVKTTQEVKP